MITVTHYTSVHGWEFACDQAGLTGGGRTRSESMAAAEHCVRHHLSEIRRADVTLEAARRELRHVTAPSKVATEAAA